MKLLRYIRRLFKRLIRKIKNRKKVRVDAQYDMPDVLTDDDILRNRQEIIRLLKSTDRSGIDKVIEYLEKNNFFVVPASVHHHHNWRGGLAQHSLDVYRLAHSWLQDDVSDKSLIIACILHDVCKSDQLIYDDNGVLYRINRYATGHGARSVSILQKCKLDMRENERLAIRWHMGGHNAHSQDNAEVNYTRKQLLWKFVHYADRQDAGRTE